MAQETPNLIEFHFGTEHDFPEPFAAAKAIPKWLRAMPAEARDGGADTPLLGTIKKCVPFLEAMTCGYVLPVATEVQFFMRATNALDFQQAGQVIQAHPTAQYAGSPFNNNIVIKFLNPWIVKTPPGYSTLFLPVLNAHSMPFQVLAGLVETDNYYRMIHFPAICTMSAGQRFVLPKGTPIVQAIPFKRESWQSKVSFWDSKKAEAEFANLQANPHLYKDEHWVKKDYR